MPFCPQCREEFQDWVKVCPDCGADVVESLPELPKVEKPKPDSLVTIKNFTYSEEAFLCRAKLAANGIWCFVADEHIVTANWLYSTAVGGVKLQVRESEIKDALQALQEVEATPSQNTSSEGEICPRCHSNNIHFETFRIRPMFIIWALTLFINAPEGGFTFPILKNKWKCKDCGFEWKSIKNGKLMFMTPQIKTYEKPSQSVNKYELV